MSAHAIIHSHPWKRPSTLRSLALLSEGKLTFPGVLAIWIANSPPSNTLSYFFSFFLPPRITSWISHDISLSLPHAFLRLSKCWPFESWNKECLFEGEPRGENAENVTLNHEGQCFFFSRRCVASAYVHGSALGLSLRAQTECAEMWHVPYCSSRHLFFRPQ